MGYSQRELEMRANLYADSRDIVIEKRLGYGNDGTIWQTNRKTAVKVEHVTDSFERELAAFQRLTEHKIDRINGFDVPQLVDFDERVLTIEMEIVTPPYLLDFGKVYLDIPPDYSPEVLRDWEEERTELFGPERWKVVRKLLASLKMFGIYYYDAKPGNIEFGDQPPQCR
jgi:hypothetical protein